MPGRTARVLRVLDPREASVVGAVVRSQTAGGVAALVAAAVALVWANLAGASYADLRHVTLGPLDLEHWAADGGLTLFFVVAGLELKRELVLGSLRRPADAAVPIVAASCGVIVPTLIFVAFNRGTDNLHGWAIPSATDIAFALAVLGVVGSALPLQLRAFLLTLAVVDDLIVIVVIAVAYTGALAMLWLAGAVLLFAIYAALQARRVRGPWLPLVVAVIAWWCTYRSGVHPTVAGIVVGLLTRVRPDPDEEDSPGQRLEQRLSPVSSFLAVPFFALLSAGVPLAGGADLLTHPLVWGIVAGLVLGKPLGVLGGTWLVTRFTRAELADEVTWRDLVGVGFLAGIGFTVALLVSGLAFPDVRAETAKTAVLLASVVAAAIATVLLGKRNREHAGVS